MCFNSLICAKHAQCAYKKWKNSAITRLSQRLKSTFFKFFPSLRQKNKKNCNNIYYDVCGKQCDFLKLYLDFGFSSSVHSGPENLKKSSQKNL